MSETRWDDEVRAMSRTRTFKCVEAIGRSLAGSRSPPTWGQPALKVGGRMIPCMASHKSAEPDTLSGR